MAEVENGGIPSSLTETFAGSMPVQSTRFTMRDCDPLPRIKHSTVLMSVVEAVPPVLVAWTRLPMFDPLKVTVVP
jgi:hypothetical protein